MTSTLTDPSSARPDPGTEGRPRLGIALVPGQVGYQLRLLARNPLGSFISLIVPLMLLIALDLVTPEMTLQSLGGISVTQFLTPAMASFAVLNAAFVDVVIGTTVAREEGILRRLHGTPLPTWALLSGRLVATALVTTVSVLIVLGVGIVFLHAHLAAAAVPGLVLTILVGMLVAFAVGVACSTIVPSTDAALPVAYGLLLPVRSSPRSSSRHRLRPRGSTASRRPCRSPRSPTPWSPPSPCPRTG